MTRPLTLIPLLLTLAACDVNEGPAEELGEAADELIDGRPLEEVADEAGDALERRSTLERRLQTAEDWLDDRRAALTPDDEGRKPLDALGDDIDEAREALGETGKDIGDEVDAAVDAIEAEIDELTDGS